MLKLKLIMCNCPGYNGTYNLIFDDNVKGMTTENGVCHISLNERKQVIIPLDKIVRIELESME